MTLKFHNGRLCTYTNQVILTDTIGYTIWSDQKKTGWGRDKEFDIPDNIINQSWYLNVIGTVYEHSGEAGKITHHITLSDSFKEKIPAKINFYLHWYKDEDTMFYLNFASHKCMANKYENKTISWTFKRWD